MKKKIFLLMFAIISQLSLMAKENGECFVILIEKANVSGQVYKFLDSRLTGNEIKSMWNQGKHLSIAKNTRAGWLTVYQNKKDGISQSYIYDSFKEVKKEAELQVREHRYMSSLSIAEVNTRWMWWGFFETMPTVSKQVVEMVSCKALLKWMEKQAQQGLKITACTRKFGECAVIAHNGTEIDKQQICFYKNAEEALADIQIKWKEGWRVGIMDVSMMNKYLIIYNTYTTPREGEQYIAYCDSYESASKFIQERTGNGYSITQIGGSYNPGATDENGNKLSFMEIMGGLLTKSTQLYTDIKGGNKSNGGSADTSEGNDNTSSCRTQEDYQREYDKWVGKAEKAAMKWYKNGKVDSQNSKQGQITAGERKILRGYQKIMRNVADSASKKGFSIRRSDIENFNP